MMLATWIRRFTLNNQNANKVANQWANIISRAFADGIYNHKEYVKAYRDTWGIKPSGGRVIDFVNFYPISMLCGCLDEHTEISLVDYVLNKEDGIYYIYNKRLAQLSCCFESKEASRYLGAIELLAEYKFVKDKFKFEYQ